ncbi:MAG: hypothetical protein ACK4R6_09450 [Spirosomataceae bacterium]
MTKAAVGTELYRWVLLEKVVGGYCCPPSVDKLYDYSSGEW